MDILNIIFHLPPTFVYYSFSHSNFITLIKEVDMSYTNKTVPEEIKRWNWGAFMFNIIWGFGNRSYLPLLVFVPLLNLVWIFVCGLKGNEWAWQKGDYDSVETFMKVQETWNRAGFIYFIVSIIFAVIFFLFFFSTMMAIIANSASQGMYQ